MRRQKQAYAERDTSADPHPALAQKRKEGSVREAKRLGLPVPLVRRAFKRSDLSESQGIFALYLLRHVDLDSHYIGTPDENGQLLPPSIDDIVRETGLARRTICRRIEDFVDAKYIHRWQKRDLEKGADGELAWVGFIAHTFVTYAFFRALGISDSDLEEERILRRQRRGHVTRPSLIRSRHELARRRAQSRGPYPGRQLRFSSERREVVSFVGRTARAKAQQGPSTSEASEGLRAVRANFELKNRYPDWDSWTPEARRAAIARLQATERPPPR